MAIVLLLKSFAVGGDDISKATYEEKLAERKNRLSFKGNRREYQEIPDELLKATFKNKKGEDELVLKPGINFHYLTPEMVDTDKTITDQAKKLLKESLVRLKNKNEVKLKPKKEI